MLQGDARGDTVRDDTRVAGVWNGDGKDDMGVVRSNLARGGLDWFFDLAGDGKLPEHVSQFGLLRDRPIVGDWNGDGRDDMAVTRINQPLSSVDWFFDLAGDGGAAEDILVSWGLASSTPVAGDWN